MFHFPKLGFSSSAVRSLFSITVLRLKTLTLTLRRRPSEVLTTQPRLSQGIDFVFADPFTAMAMRALLRSAAGRSWTSRSAAAVADNCSPLSRELQSDIASAAIACSSSCSSSALSQLPKSPRFSSWTGSLSRSVSELLHSFSLSASSSAAVGLRIPSDVSSFLISAPSVAPMSGYSAGLRCSLADLRLGKVYGGAQFLGGDSSALSGPMQQRRSLSKLKKYKIKPYSSYKERFKLMADGTYKRWRSGTRHNAHSKTAKQRRQLRRPSTAPAALATIMKKLNFVR